MTERPIIFSGEMVRAVLADRKTQTRRVMRPQPYRDAGAERLHGERYGVPGDLLWVRESYCEPTPGLVLYKADWSPQDLVESARARRRYPELAAAYPNSRWRPSIHMRRQASRISLTVVGVRVERLNAITDDDALAEGARYVEGSRAGLRYAGCGLWVSDGHPSYERGLSPGPRAEFACLWDRINAARGWAWDSDPWVWVIEFERKS